MNHDPLEFVEFIRRETPYLRKARVAIDLTERTSNDIRQIAADFGEYAAVDCLSRLRGVEATVCAYLTPGVLDKQEGALLFKVHISWLEGTMKRPKEIDDGLPLPSLSDTSATSPEEMHGDHRYFEHAPNNEWEDRDKSALDIEKAMDGKAK